MVSRILIRLSIGWLAIVGCIDAFAMYQGGKMAGEAFFILLFPPFALAVLAWVFRPAPQE